MLVKKRVEEELEKRKDEIELEVSKRVEAAKKQMEREMMLELEKRREEIRDEERKREVSSMHKQIIQKKRYIPTAQSTSTISGGFFHSIPPFSSKFLLPEPKENKMLFQICILLLLLLLM